jgi:hypothetical protein
MLLLACFAYQQVAPGGGPPNAKPGSDPGVAIDAAQLAALADGTLADGEKVLASWVRPFFRCRSVVSRADLGQCAVGWRIVWPAQTQGGLRTTFESRVSVDGGPWKGEGCSVTLSSPDSFGEDSTESNPESMSDVLAGSLDRDHVTIRPRLVVRVDRRPSDGKDPVAGTSWTWLGEPVTVLIRDTFPSDYPRPRSGADVDGPMRQLAASASAQCAPESQVDGALFVRVTVPPGAQSAVPAAFVAELQRPGTEETLGSTTVAWPAGPLAPWPNATQSWELRFERPGVAPSAWDAFLADLRAQRVGRLHLAFHPSRAVAVQQPDFDEYWDGSFEIDVAMGR